MSICRILLIDERGEDLAEYAIAMAMIALAIISAMRLVNTSVSTLWNQSAANLQTAAG